MEDERRRPPLSRAFLAGGLFLLALLVVFNGPGGDGTDGPATTIASLPPTTSLPPSTPTTVAATTTTQAGRASEEEVVPGWTHIEGGPTESLTGPAMAWTGRDVVVLGGVARDGAAVTAGAVYDTVSRRWREIPASPLTGMADAVVVWTGSEVVVATTTGSAALNAVDDSWRVLSPRPEDVRHPVGAVWTGTEVILVAHNQDQPRLLDQLVAVAYDPSRDSWRRLPDPPLEMSYASVLWDDDRVVLVGGFLDQDNRARSADELATAQAFDPVGDAWSILDGLDLAPNAVTAAVTPSGVLAWEYGLNARLLRDATTWVDASPVPLDFSECYPESEPVGGFVLAWYCGQGALYYPEVDAWVQVMTPPIGRSALSSGVAADDAVFFWSDSSLWRFDLEDTVTAWVEPSDVGDGWAFAAIPELQWRSDPSLVWTGDELIIWGGHGVRVEVYDGLAYDPDSGVFHRIPAADSPGRYGQQAVWTGEEMIVWRGPISAWSPQRREWRSLEVPDPVTLVGGAGVEVWTGREVLFIAPGDTESGGVAYDPAADTWRSVVPAALSERFEPAVGWSGRELYLWGGAQGGGAADSFWYQDGAAYNPFTEQWQPLPPLPSDERLSEPVGAWTGREFLVIGITRGGPVTETPQLAGFGLDPQTEQWRPLSPLPLAFPDDGDLPGSLLAVWINGEAAVWLPAPFSGDTPQLGFYDPSTDQWRTSLHLPFHAQATDMTYTGEHIAITTDAGLLLYENP